MEQTMIGTSATHLPPHKMDLYLELRDKCQKVIEEAQTDVYMNKLRRGKGSEKTAACFRFLSEMHQQEAVALKTLEKYLKEDATKHTDHQHRRDLAKLAHLLQGYNQTRGRGF